MSALTEVEIFDRMMTSLRAAIQHCESLASLPVTGPTYDAFRKELLLIEGCCRQASAWREDTRWLTMGRTMAKAHKIAGNWLRGARDEMKRKISLAPKQRYELFMKLAANLKAMHEQAKTAKNARTGRVGMILPEMPTVTRENRSMGWRRSAGGIILPSSGVA